MNLRDRGVRENLEESVEEKAFRGKRDVVAVAVVERSLENVRDAAIAKSGVASTRADFFWWGIPLGVGVTLKVDVEGEGE